MEYKDENFYSKSIKEHKNSNDIDINYSYEFTLIEIKLHNDISSRTIDELCLYIDKRGSDICNYLVSNDIFALLLSDSINENTVFKAILKIFDKCSCNISDAVIQEICSYSFAKLEGLFGSLSVFSEYNALGCINTLLSNNYLDFYTFIDSGFIEIICNNLYSTISNLTIPFIRETIWFILDNNHNTEKLQLIKPFITKQIIYLCKLIEEHADSDDILMDSLSAVVVASDLPRFFLYRETVYLIDSLFKVVSRESISVDNVMIIFDIINSMFKYYGEYLLSKYNYDKLLIDYANNNSDFLIIAMKGFTNIISYYSYNSTLLCEACTILTLFVSRYESSFREKKLFIYYYCWLKQNVPESVFLMSLITQHFQIA